MGRAADPGELHRLGYRVSNSTIRLVLRRAGLSPSPRRGAPTWREFLRAQSKAVVATDFFVVHSAMLGILYALVFIEIKSRRVIHSACTDHPDSAWVCQQARNTCMKLQDLNLGVSALIRDRDSKFTTQFDDVFKAEGARVAMTPYRCPRANGIAERLIKTTRRECLDHLIIVSERHLSRVLIEFYDHYNRSRPHRSLGLRPPHPATACNTGKIVRLDRLGGIVKEYARAA